MKKNTRKSIGLASFIGNPESISLLLRRSGNAVLCVVGVMAALAATPGSALAGDDIARLRTTINNPSPSLDAVLGGAVAGIGSNVLVGCEGNGAAYLFDATGAILTTFTSSDPAGGSFGAAVAGMGSDRVLIGAYNYAVGLAQAGRAYLFDTNGTMLTTFTNPAPEIVQAFGWTVAALGNDRVLIGGLTDDNKSAPYPGSAYLFNTNGTLLQHFTATDPSYDSGFGESVAAVGNDLVLIGAPYNSTDAQNSGAAYLFTTNGALLTTFTNPVPLVDDNFGYSLAAVGKDRVLIGASDAGNQGNGGVAYLFSTNGSLITTFNNPTPDNDLFGQSVAAVGSTRVLIGAYQDSTTDTFQAGSAYLFSTNGTLLTTISNPTPARQDWFAYSVAAVGTDQVVIGGVWDDTGATDAGSAYVFTLPYPTLNIAASAGSVSLSWETPETGLLLQEADSLGAPTLWGDTANSVLIDGVTNTVQQDTTDGSTSRFYRLQRL